ncbi:MAG: hypothetical protein QM704_11455 [Anaeromyxobacteraceae bacterium]
MRAEVALVAALVASGPPSELVEEPRRASCGAEQASRCEPGGGCARVDPAALQAERFELDLRARTLTACLYTDCLEGRATLVREPGRRWVVTAFALVRSGRKAGAAPPPGSGPMPVTLTVDLRTGRFAATWGHSPEGVQTDFGACTFGATPGR